MSNKPAAMGSMAMLFLPLNRFQRGGGIHFESKITGGAVPREYIPAVEKGVMEAAESGVLAAYPVTDIQVTLFDGSFHEVDSSEMAFKMAAIFAFKEGV